MKKQKLHFVKHIAIALAGCFLLGTLFGCTQDAPSENKNALDYTVTQSVDGKHEFNVKTTSKKLVENGATDYKVVVKDTVSGLEKSALDELIYFFKEATGITLQTVSESQVNYTETAKFISLGDNAYTQQANVVADADILGDTGLTIQTKGDSRL